jgi:hypothetical protein
MRKALAYAGIVLAAASIVIFLPKSKVTELDFRRGQIPGNWEVTGLTGIEKTNEGLHIVTERIGRIVQDFQAQHPSEAARITYRTGRSTDAYFYWHIRGKPREELVQFPFTFPRSLEPRTVSLNLAPYPQWDPLADRIGFSFPVGTDLTIERIQLIGWSPGAKILEVAKAFWTFDEVRPYTINFVWGPLLVWNPVAREQLFAKVPPMARSANTVFYVILGIGLGSLLLIRRSSKPGRQRMALLSFLGLLAGLWFLYDLRMGLEFLSYVRDDYVTYLSEPLGRRTFRELDFFDDVARAVAPGVAKEQRYVFIPNKPSPYAGLMRYHTYPSVPVGPDDSKDVPFWFIYKRPDITLGPGGELVSNGKAISPPGRVFHEYEPGTFVFIVNP